MTKVLWLPLAALLIIGLSTGSAAAQTPTQISAALQAAQTALTNVQAAIAATNVATARADLTAAQANLQQVRAALQSIESQATDDAIRSRASGLLAHINAALDSVQAGLTGPDAEVASRANAARGEIQEALNEVPPVPSVSPSVSPSPVPTPTALPPTGSPASSIWLAAMLAASGLLLLGGRLLALRTRKPAISGRQSSDLTHQT